MGMEKKFIDISNYGFYGQTPGAVQLAYVNGNTPNVGGTSPANATITLLNGLKPGSDATQRIGRKILMKSVLIRIVYQWNFNNFPYTGFLNQGTDQCRTLLVYDKQTNGVVPTIDLLLQPNVSGSVSGTSYAVSAPLNLDNRDRFTVLYDKTFSVNPVYIVPTTGGLPIASQNWVKQIKIYKKLNHEVIYNSGVGGLVGDVNTGGLFLFTIGTLASASIGTSGAANGGYSNNFSIRTRFTDP